MKKTSIRLLCLWLALCLFLAACGTEPADPTTQATTEVTTEATTEATTEPTEAPRISMVESTEPIKNIILIIGDGMGVEHVKAGQLYDGKEYDFAKWPMVRVNTLPVEYSGKLSDEPTDSAASATAMATGTLTVNNYVGMLTDGTELQTIMDKASSLGKATGIVTTDQLFGATPSAFSAHSRSRSSRNVLLESQLDSGVNLLCGDLHEACTVMRPQIEEKGYAYSDDILNLNFEGDKAYWQLPLAGVDALTPLQDISIEALNYLDRDPEGFVLMIEQGHIDKFSHNKDFESTCVCVSNLNKTVEAVMAWLGDRTDTAVLITADHETGGLVCSGEEGTYANPVEGPNGTIYYEYRSGGHTMTDVALYVYGVTVDFTKSEVYKDEVLKNTGVYYLMSDILNIEANRNKG